jgi:anti-sigma-K factor RskA
MTPEERDELLAAYALGTLPGPEAAAVEELVRHDSAAASELARYHEVVDLVALNAPLRRADPSLRDRVLDVARAGREERVVWFRWTRWQVASVAAAVLGGFVILGWGLSVQQQLSAQSRQNASLAAIVEASAKRIEQLTQNGASQALSEDLKTQLQTALADQELLTAINADQQAKMSVLEPTAAGHGAVARYLWSGEAGAGVLLARGLPDLPLDSVYQVWFDDGKKTFSVGTFTPDERSAVQKVVRLPSGAGAPRRVSVSVAPAGGSCCVGRLVVLSGAVLSAPSDYQP